MMKRIREIACERILAQSTGARVKFLIIDHKLFSAALLVKRCKLQPTQHVLKKALGQCCTKRTETASSQFSFTSNTAIRTVRKISFIRQKREIFGQFGITRY